MVVTWGERGWASYRRAVMESGAADPGIEWDSNHNGECIGSCIWLNDKSPSTLLHELHHVTTRALEYVKVDDEECEAYLQTWLFNRVMAKWGRK